MWYGSLIPYPTPRVGVALNMATITVTVKVEDPERGMDITIEEERPLIIGKGAIVPAVEKTAQTAVARTRAAVEAK